jgi:outer membrane protein
MKHYVIAVMALFAFIVATASCGGKETPAPKIVFMDNFKVFEAFEMKKDYDKMIEKQLGSEQLQLDSMASVLNALQNPVQIDVKKKQLFEAQQAFEQRFQSLSDQYTQEVYARLNTYIKAYGKEKGYTMIMGSDGQGSVMYVDTTVNITTDLIRYINKEYTK